MIERLKRIIDIIVDKKQKSRLIRAKNYLFPSPEVFGVSDFEKREKYRDDYKILADSLSSHISFDSMMDVGCANGFLMDLLLSKGYHVSGLEASPHVVDVLPDHIIDRVLIGDFTLVSGKYDLVCCVEVAEHIEPSRSKELVETLSRTANSNIYFTAAPPGQDGHGHINCRPHKQWLDWFEEEGWIVDEELTIKLRSDINMMEKAIWLEPNSFILCRVN